MLVMDADGNITDVDVSPFAGESIDYFTTMTGQGVQYVDEMGAVVPGLQEDSPYVSAYDEQVLIPGGGETPLTADVPYNISDQAAPNGFNASAPGAIKDGGGIGEWVTNGFKSLANGFLGTMTKQATAVTTQQPGGSFGTPGPGILGRFGTAAAPAPGSVAGNTLGMNAQSLTWLVALLAGFILVMSIRSK